MINFFVNFARSLTSLVGASTSNCSDEFFETLSLSTTQIETTIDLPLSSQLTAKSLYCDDGLMVVLLSVWNIAEIVRDQGTRLILTFP
jgi:hypothetical protein